MTSQAALVVKGEGWSGEGNEGCGGGGRYGVVDLNI